MHISQTQYTLCIVKKYDLNNCTMEFFDKYRAKYRDCGCVLVDIIRPRCRP